MITQQSNRISRSRVRTHPEPDVSVSAALLGGKTRTNLRCLFLSGLSGGFAFAQLQRRIGRPLFVSKSTLSAMPVTSQLQSPSSILDFVKIPVYTTVCPLRFSEDEQEHCKSSLHVTLRPSEAQEN
jgi:hypothetical protein